MSLPRFPFDNSYARLPEVFFRRCEPKPASTPGLICFNHALADSLGIDVKHSDEASLAEVFSGNQLPEGADSLAMAYCGHQFGNLVPLLGDGRAILLGEVVDAYGKRRDIQLKGAGKTPFSRPGSDGLAPLGPVLREYLVSEAMYALGIPTTRALAAVTTGEQVVREYPQPGAVITRVAASHIRVGTFQYLALQDDRDQLQRLADYVIARHFPNAMFEDNPYLELLRCVSERQASLVAQWMSIGFIHGVMNTDNMTVSGETLDYGPCAFMDAYHPETVFSSIDVQGRYSFENQPYVARWNLARLAETLLPLIDEDQDVAIEKAKAVLEDFMPRYDAFWLDAMRAKLGLENPEEDDATLLEALLQSLADHRVDFTLFFRYLCRVAEDPGDDAEVAALFRDANDWHQWSQRWQQRLQRESVPAVDRGERMRAVNPAVIPRNHRVEEAIRAAEDKGDFEPFHRLLAMVTDPYREPGEHPEYMQPPAANEQVVRTFCGT